MNARHDCGLLLSEDGSCPLCPPAPPTAAQVLIADVLHANGVPLPLVLDLATLIALKLDAADLLDHGGCAMCKQAPRKGTRLCASCAERDREMCEQDALAEEHAW